MADKELDEASTLGTNMYVRQVLPYTRGGIFRAASELSNSEFQALESSLLGVPPMPEVNFTLSEDDLNLMYLMANHVTIRAPRLPVRFLHVYNATALALKYTKDDPSEVNIDKCVAIIENEFTVSNTTIKFSDLLCNCQGHKKYREKVWNFQMLLARLMELDVREKLEDQSIAQCLASLVNFISFKENLGIECAPKGASLQTSCIVYNASDSTVYPLNSTPDFIIKGPNGEPVGVGEMESSPYKQMVVAGLGHIGQPYVRYLLGLCLSKTRQIDMYLIESSLGIKIHCEEVYEGDIHISKLTTEPYSLQIQEDIKRFLKKLVTVLKFIVDDFTDRINSIGDAPQSIISSPSITRQSKRKSIPADSNSNQKAKRKN